jgi:hypothetical protein
MKFEEIIKHIQQAQAFVESEVNEEFDEIVEKSYETLEFVAGHIVGMRDAMVMVQAILARSVLGEEE